MTQLYAMRMLCILLFSLAASPMLLAQPITVTSTANDGPGSLRQAVLDAAPRSFIYFDPSTNGTPIVLDEDLIAITKNLRIIGNGREQTIISGGGNSRVFSIRNGALVRIRDLTIRDGFAAKGGGVRVRTGCTLYLSDVDIRECIGSGPRADEGGGGIQNEGTLYLNRCLITENEATGFSGSGGGILNAPGGSMRLTFTTVSNNTANRAGAGIEDASGLGGFTDLRNSIITGNVLGGVPGNGGGIHVGGDGEISIAGGSITDNFAPLEGGGLWLGTGEMEISGSTISGNTASGAGAANGGGGIYNLGGTLLVRDQTTISGNAADGSSGSGGGILNFGALTVRNSTLSGNTAVRAGGGIEDASGSGPQFLLVDVTITGNVASGNPGNGGGVHLTGDGNLSVVGGSISSNEASSEGGGLWNSTGLMRLRSTLIEANIASGDDATEGGGGVFNNGGRLVINPATQIINNQATGTLGSGGGVFNAIAGTEEAPIAGILFVNNAIISGNTAVRAGGGIEDNSGPISSFNIINATISDNAVTGVAADGIPGNGGGIHIGSAGNAQIFRSRITGNTATQEGGGLWNDLGTMRTVATLIDGNTSAGDDPDQGGGGAYNNGGTLIIDQNCVVSNNVATGTSGSGGGLFNATDGTLTVIQSSIDNNTANRAGGGIEDASGLGGGFSATRTRITNNDVVGTPGNGGGVHVGGEGDAVFNRIEVASNTASGDGGGLWNGLGNMSISRGVITLNSATGDGDAEDIAGGGGIYNEGGTVEVLLSTQITGNSATGATGSGGGILTAGDPGVVSARTVIVNGATISGNTATRAGGGVEVVLGDFTATGTTFTDNSTGASPGNGGALHVTGVESNVDLNGGVVTGNSATNEGGGLWNQAGSFMEVTQVMISNNTVSNDTPAEGAVLAGAGIFNNGGDVNVTRSTLSGNSVVSGGAVAGAGGAVANSGDGDLTLEVSTLTGNSAAVGGALANASVLNIVNTTITDNEATASGGGIAQGSTGLIGSSTPSLTIQGSVLSANSPDDLEVTEGIATSAGFNFVGTGVSADLTLAATDLVGDAPQFGMLMDNGGSTMTLKPECGSPLIGAGNPDDKSRDQLGRTIRGVRDIGAFEVRDVCAALDGGVAEARTTTASSAAVAEVLTAYPNPIQGNELTVTIPTYTNGTVTLRVLDIDGKVRRTSTVQGGSNYPLDVSNYSNGAYILQIVDTQSTETLRFVVNR